MKELIVNEHLILNTCDPRLISLFKEVAQHFDIRIICGHRGSVEQNRDFENGRSKFKFPDSKHNKIPSKAVDVCPYPVDWDDISRFMLLSKVVKALAIKNNINIKWGGDYLHFKDYPHWELVA